MGPWLMLVCLVAGIPAVALSGLCRYETSVPGLPTAVCKFPGCPSGGDCEPPALNTAASEVEFFEPLLRWRDECPAQSGLSGPCWEISLEIAFEIKASDPSGISQVGVHLYEERQARRQLRRVFSPAARPTSTGAYVNRKSVIFYSKPRQTFELGVYEICAVDGMHNETCALPGKQAQRSLKQLW